MNKKYSHAKYICTFCVSLFFALLLNTGSAFAADFGASGNVSMEYNGPVSSLPHISTSDKNLKGYYTVVPIAAGQTVTGTIKEDEHHYYVFYSEAYPASTNFIVLKTLSEAGTEPSGTVSYLVKNYAHYVGKASKTREMFLADSSAIASLKNYVQQDYEKKGTGLYFIDIDASNGDCEYSLTLPALEGAEISFTPGTEGAATPAVVYSNSNGAWSQTGCTDGAAYTVSASKPGYTITPSVQTITGSSNVADFTATPDSYPSIVSAISDKPVIQCGESGLYGGGVANVGTVTLTVKTSGLNDGTVVGAYLVTSQKADVQVSAANHQRTIAYGRVNDNEAIIEVNPSQLRPGRYEFMVMIPGLSTPAYVPMTLLRSDSSLVPSITDITLSTESMSNKDSGVVTVNIQTENVPDYYNTYVWKQSFANFLPVPYDTVCNVALLKQDGSSVVNTDWIFKDNTASIAFNVPDLPTGSYRFKVMFNTKTHVGYPVRDHAYADILDTPLVAYKDFTVYDAETSNDITGFAVPGQSGAAVIDSANHTVSFSMPYGSDVTALRPDITINGASVSPASGADVDFSSPVTCTVTAQNGMRQKWTVTCSVYAESFSYKSITAYSITGQTGNTSIDSANRTLTLEMPDGTDLNSLVASFTNSTGASVTVNGATQTSGSTDNSFRTPLEYTVTAQDGSTAVWTVYIICNTRQFELSAGSLDQTSGVTASVTVAPATGLEHDGTEMVVFQLMKGDLPAGIIAVKRDIQTDQQVQAYFDVEGTGYSVKVFVFDRLSYESGNTQVNLAEPILLQ